MVARIESERWTLRVQKVIYKKNPQQRETHYQIVFLIGICMDKLQLTCCINNTALIPRIAPSFTVVPHFLSLRKNWLERRDVYLISGEVSIDIFVVLLPLPIIIPFLHPFPTNSSKIDFMNLSRQQATLAHGTSPEVVIILVITASSATRTQNNLRMQTSQKIWPHIVLMGLLGFSRQMGQQ